MFFGAFNHTIDAKGRTSLPAKLRESLAAAGEPRIVLMQFPHWRSILAVPQSLWIELTRKVMEASPLDLRWQRTILKFVSTAHEVDLDPHGRVLVPPPLREWAGLSKEVVWVGAGKVIHLWDKGAWEQHMATEVSADQVVDLFKGA
jgi:MraZ protein